MGQRRWVVTNNQDDGFVFISREDGPKPVQDGPYWRGGTFIQMAMYDFESIFGFRPERYSCKRMFISCGDKPVRQRSAKVSVVKTTTDRKIIIED